MFGFDGNNEILGEDEYLPVVTAYAPSQVLQKVPAQVEVPLTTPIKATKISLFDAIPRLSEIGTMTSAENTGTLIERLWEATGEIEALEGSWNSGPTTLSARFQQTDRRWGLIGAAVVGLIVIVLILANLGSGPVAAPELGPATQAVQAAADTIDDLTVISGSLANPAAPTDSISGAAVELAVIDRAARDLSTSASSLTSWEGYEAAASALSAAADQGSAIESRLGAALSYRLVSDTLFVPPALPIEAEGALSAQLSFDLAAMVADAERAVARLPRDPALATHRLESERLVDDMLPMIDRYLEALRNSDSAAAQTAANGIIDRITANQRTRVAGYETFNDEMTELAGAYSDRLQTAAVLLSELP